MQSEDVFINSYRMDSIEIYCKMRFIDVFDAKEEFRLSELYYSWMYGKALFKHGCRVLSSEKEPLNCLAKRKVWRLDQSFYWQYLVKE